MYLLILLASAAYATVPIAPSFPGCGNPETPELCPPDLEEDWELINYIPERSLGSVREAELDLGSGIAANLAFETTTGRWDVILAVADSGVGPWPGYGDAEADEEMTLIKKALTITLLDNDMYPPPWSSERKDWAEWLD